MNNPRRPRQSAKQGIADVRDSLAKLNTDVQALKRHQPMDRGKLDGLEVRVNRAIQSINHRLMVLENPPAPKRWWHWLSIPKRINN